MSAFQRGPISMDEICDLVAGTSAPAASSAPQFGTVAEHRKGGPRSTSVVDIPEHCWERFTMRSAEIELPPFTGPAENVRTREWWRGEDESECWPEVRRAYILGEYRPSGATITYYDLPAISDDEREIVQIHERMHAVHHSILDGHGRMWDAFPNISACALEMLAQIFTYKFLERSHYTRLTWAMQDMARRQGLWYRMPLEILQTRNMSGADCVNLYWDIREYGALRGAFGAYCEHVERLLADAAGSAPARRRAPSSGGQGKDDRMFSSRREPLVSVGGHPVYLLTYSPLSGEADDIDSCLNSRRISADLKKVGSRPEPGARGFLLHGDSEFVAIIEVVRSWAPDPIRPGVADLEFRVLELWRPGLPFAVMKKYKGLKRLSHPVHAFKNHADGDMILVAHDAMIQGLKKARDDLHALADRAINEVMRRAFSE